MWSWILEGIGLLGATLIGRKLWVGWLLLSFNAVLWFTYGMVSKEYGFCVASIPYAAIYSRNTYRWKQTHSRLPSKGSTTPSVGL